VYSKAELSPLPFQPPAAYTYFVTMLSGTFKVGSHKLYLTFIVTDLPRIAVTAGSRAVCTCAPQDVACCFCTQLLTLEMSMCCIYAACACLQVFQYVITIMVALMVTQHAIERYWSAGRQVTSFQMLMFVLFVSHPLLTLLLVVLSNNEIAARRFMYYRCGRTVSNMLFALLGVNLLLFVTVVCYNDRYNPIGVTPYESLNESLHL
jgi:hypothetical protein